MSLGSVIISHPARQATVYYWPRAAQAAGLDVTFLTGLYYKPHRFPYNLTRFLPSAYRRKINHRLELRRLSGLDPEAVVSVGGPWLEVLFRQTRSYRTWNLLHDALAARWIRRNVTRSQERRSSGASILHCFQGTGTRSFAVAKKKGIHTVLELTLPPAFAAAATNHGAWRLPPSAASPEDVRAIREADYVVAQSRYGVDYLLHQGVLPSRIILLPFGVDTERFRPVVRDRSTTFRVLFAGQLGVRKGLHILLEAWQKLALPDAELVLVGGLGDQGAAILDAFGAHRYWRGFVSDDELPDLYRSSDVFVLPSFSEGGANVVYEALASGVTCVVSKNAGSAVREGAEGFVVDVGDTEALADRIQTLYRDRELCANMGVAARRQAERYSWSEFSRRLAATYRNIATGWPDWPNDIRDMSAY